MVARPPAMATTPTTQGRESVKKRRLANNLYDDYAGLGGVEQEQDADDGQGNAFDQEEPPGPSHRSGTCFGSIGRHRASSEIGNR